MPIQFTCPHCGAQTSVSDEYAGQSGPCAQCGRTVTIPPPGAPPAYSPPPRSSSGAPVLVVVLIAAVGVFVVCSGILAALLLPAVQAAREAARRTQCLNNMKQIGLAMLNYESDNGCFPPAYIPDEDGNPMHSWRVLLLPYMEHKPLYDMYNFDEPWDSPQNQALADLMPEVFRCASEASDNPSDTSYVMVVGPGCISDGPKANSIRDFHDGTSNTLILVESAGSGINWLEPRDWDTEVSNFFVHDGDGQGPESDHPGVVNVVFADGSVQSLDAGTDPEQLKAMTTIAGGEAVDRFGLDF